jgi:hypothetical protein
MVFLGFALFSYDFPKVFLGFPLFPFYDPMVLLWFLYFLTIFTVFSPFFLAGFPGSETTPGGPPVDRAEGGFRGAALPDHHPGAEPWQRY